MRTSRPAAAAVLTLLAPAVLILAACASDDPGGRGGPGSGRGGPPEPRRDPHKDASLFISPAGKPFRADPGKPYPVRDWFAQADANHDGKITREEFRADFEAFFKTLDLDHDGILDGEEIRAYEETVAPEILPRIAQMANEVRQPDPIGTVPGSGRRSRAQPRQLAQAPPRRGQGGFDGAPEFSLQNVSEPVLGADVNFDGKVSLEEFLAAADRRFDSLDNDRLGYLTRQSLPYTPEQEVLEGKKPKDRR